MKTLPEIFSPPTRGLRLSRAEMEDREAERANIQKRGKMAIRTFLNGLQRAMSQKLSSVERERVVADFRLRSNEKIKLGWIQDQLDSVAKKFKRVDAAVQNVWKKLVAYSQVRGQRSG